MSYLLPYSTSLLVLEAYDIILTMTRCVLQFLVLSSLLFSITTAFYQLKRTISSQRKIRGTTPLSVTTGTGQRTTTTIDASPVVEVGSIIEEKLGINFFLDSFGSSDQSTSLTPLLFLPGLDGIGNYSSESIFTNVSSTYECWRMTVDPGCRQSFLEVAALVIKKLQSFDRPAVVIGESFGGLLASYIGTRSESASLISRLVLVNPATSYDRTQWPIVGPLIASSGPAFPFLGISALMLTAVERNQFFRIGQQISDRINSTESAIEEITKMVEGGGSIMDLLPPDTLNFRLKEWLLLGTFLMNDKDRYKKLVTPTLIITGTEDRLLPSLNEGRRLKGLLSANQPGNTVELVELPAGHAIMDDAFDLAEIMRASSIFAKDFKSSASKDDDQVDPYACPYPSDADLEDIDKQFDGFTKAVSPIFLSRRGDGSVANGIR